MLLSSMWQEPANDARSTDNYNCSIDNSDKRTAVVPVLSWQTIIALAACDVLFTSLREERATTDQQESWPQSKCRRITFLATAGPMATACGFVYYRHSRIGCVLIWLPDTGAWYVLGSRQEDEISHSDVPLDRLCSLFSPSRQTSF